MTIEELIELVHLLLMCGIMGKSALESGNLTNEEWLRMTGLIDKYQTEKPGPKEDPKPIIKCKDCKYQVKEWRKDKRRKEKGYWVYGCEHFGEIMGYWGFGGNDNEFCSDAEQIWKLTRKRTR